MNKETSRWIITFGSDHLPEIAHKIRPLKIMLIIEAPTEKEARDIVFKSFIGEKFATSYFYSQAERFKEDYNMIEYSLQDLETLRK